MPNDNGGSPITGYRVVLLYGGNVIRNNTTDNATSYFFVEDLSKSTNYTVKVFAKNKVFEGNASVTKIRTNNEGEYPYKAAGLSDICARLEMCCFFVRMFG